MSTKTRHDTHARRAALKEQQRRQQRRRTFLWVGAAVVAGAVLVAGTVWLTGRTSRPATNGQPVVSGLQAYTGLSRQHVPGPVDYPQTPPVGGEHSATWQNCGVYTTPVRNENAVHSLEHGAMWITYQPTLPKSQVAVLRAAAAGQPYALVSPYPGLSAPVVATVWGAQVRLDSASDPRLRTFIDYYASGSHAPEPGGECTGGVGTPAA